MPGTATKRRRGATGCCAPPPARRNSCKTIYGLAANASSASGKVDWLPGYEASRPVRVGNAAHEQLQIDVFGEVMDALHQARRGRIEADDSEWPFQERRCWPISRRLDAADEGIWEVRGGPQHFTFSKVMAWVALDRAVKTVEAFGLEGPVDRWRAIRHQIHADVCERGFDRARGCFVQAYGSKQLDASLLMLRPPAFFPPPTASQEHDRRDRARARV